MGLESDVEKTHTPWPGNVNLTLDKDQLYRFARSAIQHMSKGTKSRVHEAFERNKDVPVKITGMCSGTDVASDAIKAT